MSEASFEAETMQGSQPSCIERDLNLNQSKTFLWTLKMFIKQIRLWRY